jgi:hypothetical protein
MTQTGRAKVGFVLVMLLPLLLLLLLLLLLEWRMLLSPRQDGAAEVELQVR